MSIHNNFIKTFLLILLIHCLNSHKAPHGHHSNLENNDTLFSPYIKMVKDMLIETLSGLDKQQQSYMGAFIVSTPSIPIMVLLMIMRIRNLKILNSLSAFASGALIGDVFIHNVPEIMLSSNKVNLSNIENYYLKSTLKFFVKKEILFCFGIIAFFFIEKMITLLTSDKEEENHKESSDHHHHGHSTKSTKKQLNIIICIVGDTLHNVTDGLALGAAFSKSLLLGITLTISIFFHEIPHEVGDFSYLLKQNMSVIKAFATQILSAIGAFIGVYLSFLIGENYSDQILAFASGTFIYISVNTILGDLKETKTIISLFSEFIAISLGVFMMYIFI